MSALGGETPSFQDAGNTPTLGVGLTEREIALQRRILGSMLTFPDSFKSWVTTWVEFNAPRLLATDIVGIGYPWIIDIDVFPTATNTNWDTLTNATGSVYNFWKVSSAAQNDEISWSVLLPAGTWTLELMHNKDANRGIYTVTLNTTTLGTIDGYAAAPSANVRSTITAINATSTAKRTLKLKMATKNGSSSNYSGAIQHIQLRRTS